MRALISAAALAMCMMPAMSQSTNSQAAKRPMYNDYLLNEEARVKDCVKQWDRSTHMTRKQWETTCRRVAKERVQHLRK
jgi:hypothetical protein